MDFDYFIKAVAVSTSILFLILGYTLLINNIIENDYTYNWLVYLLLGLDLILLVVLREYERFE